MPRIKLKNSQVQNKAPLATDLEAGELAVNTHKDSPAVYLKDTAGAVVKVAGPGAVGMGTVTSVGSGTGLSGGPITTAGSLAVDRTTTDTWYTPAAHVGSGGTSHAAASTSANGFMSSTDKAKLNGIAAGATANTGTVTSVATSGALTGGPITSSGTLSVRTGTTAHTGVVQLSSSHTSTSTTLAATPSAVKAAYDLANSKYDAGDRILGADGTAAAPGFAFNADTNTGLFRPGTDELAFSTGGAQRMLLNAQGNLTIGTGTVNTTPGLFIKGGTTASTNIPFQVVNGAGQNIMRFQNDRAVFSEGIYNHTVALSPNIAIGSLGKVGRSTSSIKYKTDVETLEDSYADTILNCRPVWFRSLCDSDNPAWGYWGFIAEEVYKIDPRLTFLKTEKQEYDENGIPTQVVPLDEPEVEGVQYDRFVPHLVNLIRRQRDQIQSLEARVAALEGGSSVKSSDPGTKTR